MKSEISVGARRPAPRGTLPAERRRVEAARFYEVQTARAETAANVRELARLRAETAALRRELRAGELRWQQRAREDAATLEAAQAVAEVDEALAVGVGGEES